MPGAKLGYDALKAGWKGLTKNQKTTLGVAGGAAALLAGGVALNQITGAKHNPVTASVGMGVLAGGLVMAPKLAGNIIGGMGKGATRSGATNKMLKMAGEMDVIARGGAPNSAKILDKMQKKMIKIAEPDKQAKDIAMAFAKDPTKGVAAADRSVRKVDRNLMAFGQNIKRQGGSLKDAAMIGGTAAAATAAIGGTMRVADRRQ